VDLPRVVLVSRKGIRTRHRHNDRIREDVMSVQSDNQAATRRKNKRTQKRLGNSEVHDALYDVDVIDMVSAEVDKRAAALHGMIAEAAYFRAEKRGFGAGHELDDWLGAEKEVEQLLQQHASAAHLS
jgi:hypothetical protein